MLLLIAAIYYFLVKLIGVIPVSSTLKRFTEYLALILQFYLLMLTVVNVVVRLAPETRNQDSNNYQGEKLRDYQEKRNTNSGDPF